MTDSAIPRRYAVLGEPVDCELTAALRASDTHEVVVSLLPSAASDVGDGDAWKTLLNDDRVEAVLVLSDAPEVLEASRQLATRGKAVVVRVTSLLPAEFVTELSLYESEGTSTLIPWFEGRVSFSLLSDWLDAAALGSVTSLHLERVLPVDDRPQHSDSPHTDSPLPDSPLTDQMIADIDMLRRLGGDYSQVTLLRSGSSENAPFLTQTLGLTGEGLPDATCLYRRTSSGSPYRLQINGTQTHAEIWSERPTKSNDREDACFVRIADGEPQPLPKSSSADARLALLDAAWRNETHSPRWRDLVRVFDIGEAMQRSLRRRRTIDLHFETVSERSQFKTQMAAIGCGIIMWTMFGIISLLFAGATLDPRDSMQRTAETSDFVIPVGEFAADAATLTDIGERHLEDIAQRMTLSEAVVFVEAVDGDAGAEDLDQRRLSTVRQSLTDRGWEPGEVETRTVVRPIAGRWFTTIMQMGRLLVFAPVGLFLAVQLLLMVAKPPAASSPT